jgi:hypothetical protein
VTVRETLHAKLTRSLLGHPDEPPVLDLVEGLYGRAKALVETLDEREKYHGSLIGPETLMLVNDLRLELAKWK